METRVGTRGVGYCTKWRVVLGNIGVCLFENGWVRPNAATVMISIYFKFELEMAVSLDLSIAVGQVYGATYVFCLTSCSVGASFFSLAFFARPSPPVHPAAEDLQHR